MNKIIITLLFGTVMLAACGGDAAEPTSTPLTDTQPVPTPLPEPTLPPSAAAETVDEPDDAQEESAAEPTPTSEPAENEASDPAPAEGDEAASSEEPVSGTHRDPEEISVPAADGLSLMGTFYPVNGTEAKPSPGLLVLHMNGGRRGDWGDAAAALVEEGYSVLVLDMRGHGQTGGATDWDLAADDIQRAWQYLVDREDVDEGRSAIVGASIGANMALVTGAAVPGVQTVVLLSPGLDYFGVTTDDKILEYGNRPVMIVASEEDTYAAQSSKSLSELVQGDSELVLYDGAGHGTRMFSAQPELIELIVEWLDQRLDSSAGLFGESRTDSRGYPLFDMAWDDLSIFQDGLIDSDKEILHQLTCAPVYHLDLDFSEDMSSFNGLMQLGYTNQEDVPLEELYFHLYPNRLGGELTIGQVAAGGQSILPVYMASNTVMALPLPEPLAPGDKIVVDMDFNMEIPTSSAANFGLLTASDEALALAHFYPQLAVFDRNGWNIDIPPGIPDITYSDSAYYLVRLSIPNNQQIIASGQQVDLQRESQRDSITFAAGPVRDFYLASGADYTSLSQQVGETTINSYGLDSTRESQEAALDPAAYALRALNQEIGPYPFTELDVVAMPTLAGGLALGIEYPGIVVINSELYNPEALLGSSDTPASVLLEATVAHEIGHQWFYSTVGSDQVDEPWLDESLVQYITYQYYRSRYGDAAAEGFRDALVSRWGQIDFETIPIGSPAGNYSPLAYSAIVYGRGPLFFEALAGEMGEQTFDQFLADYYTQNKWGLATGEGFKALAETHCDCDLTPLFAEWVIDT